MRRIAVAKKISRMAALVPKERNIYNPQIHLGVMPELSLASAPTGRYGMCDFFLAIALRACANRDIAPRPRGAVNKPKERYTKNQVSSQRFLCTGLWFVHHPLKGWCYPSRYIFIGNAIRSEDA